LGCFFAEPQDPEAVATVCLVIFIITISIVFSLAFHRIGSLLMASFSNKKSFDYFICHHKEGSGCLARYLKMIYTEANAKCFVDSDDLTDITKLFSYVSDTATIVVINSPDLVWRKWCMGEITTARMHNVPTVVINFPGVELPDDEAISNYAEYVPDVATLAKFGIDLPMIQESLRWLRTLPSFKLPTLVEPKEVQQLVNLVSENGSHGVKVSDLTFHKSDAATTTETAMVVDRANSEAVCAAYILKALLTPLCLHDPKMQPTIILSGEDVPSTTKTLIVVCSTGCFEQKDMISSLLSAAELTVRCLPIVQEDSFRFPCDNYVAVLQQMAPQLLRQGSGYSKDDLISTIRGVFGEIAVVLNPSNYSTTEAVLQVKAEQIFQRIASPKLTKLPKPQRKVLMQEKVVIDPSQKVENEPQALRAVGLGADKMKVDIGNDVNTAGEDNEGIYASI
jgi:hypothetical protein